MEVSPAEERPHILRLKLEDFLNTCVYGEPFILGPVDTLVVIHWYFQDWDASSTAALSKICRFLKVKTLVLEYSTLPFDMRFLFKLAHHIPLTGEWNECVFMSNLKAIEITYINTLPSVFGDLLQKSNVYRLTWHTLRHAINSDLDRIPADVNTFLRELYAIRPNPFRDSYCLRELLFTLPWIDKPIPFVLSAWTGFEVRQETLYMEDRLARHQKGFRKCSKAAMILLGLKRRDGYRRCGNVLGLLARMIWETRGTNTWIDSEGSLGRLTFEFEERN